MTVIALPNGFQPEGVAARSDGRVFVGSLRDGDIWQGDLDGRLVVVNARFDIAEPSETDEYELVVLEPQGVEVAPE